MWFVNPLEIHKVIQAGLTKKFNVGGFVCVPILYEARCNVCTLHIKIWVVLLYLFGLSLQQLNSFKEGNY
jgi:hypothetical protein